MFAEVNTNRKTALDFLNRLPAPHLLLLSSTELNCFGAHIEIVDTRDGVPSCPKLQRKSP
jgi:hypothetical protein